jgi:autotransporter-associated beta strand protein
MSARRGRALRFQPLEERRLLSVNVTTARYDLARDAANTSETTLTPSNVNTSSFGKIASMTVDAQVYTQPLIMNGVAVPGYGTHNVVYVATENDTVYALDAQGNNPAQGYLWKTSLLDLDVSNTGETAVPETDYGTTDITPILGITGTPVIDPTTNTLYVVGLFKETNATYQQRLYALDITDGAVKLGGPAVISATVAGTGTGTSGGQVTFSAFRENQRSALTLANGEVYIAWSSHGDQNPWHGWVMAYNAATLHQDYVLCLTPNGDAGGIWMSGGGIAVDSSGNLYLTTGNGTFDANSTTSPNDDYGMTLLKLSPSLVPEDYFAPYNQASLSNADLDYGCSNVILLSNQSSGPANEVLSEGKWGTIFLNNAATGQLGEYNANGTGPNDDLGQANISTSTTSAIVHNTIAYWDGSVYSGGDALPIKAFAAGNGTLGTTPTSESSHVFGTAGVDDGQGAGLSVSSNGNSNGILWALDNSGFNSNPAVLYAYSATNLNTVLWTSSEAAGGRDTGPDAVKFQTPVVANGYVYVAGTDSVTIYGLLPVASASPSPVIGKTTNLSVPAAVASSTYTWATSSAPSGATLPTFSANGTAAANNSTATFYMAGNYTFTCTITNSTTGGTTSTSVNVTVIATLTSGLSSIFPSTATVVNGGSLQFVGGGTDQFGNPMTAPANWVVNSGGAGGSVDSNGFYTAPSSGTGTDTVTATSGTSSASATVTVVVPAAPVAQVSLSGYFNRDGIVPDGASFSGGGLDGGGNALSGNLLGTNVVFSGNTFTIAPASTTVNNVVYATGQTITLPQGTYAYLEILADGTDGNQTSQTLTVTYTDSTTSPFTQTFGDWVKGSSGISGQSVAVTMGYRDTSNGGTDAQTTYVYGYKFALTAGKTIKSLTLPSDTNLEVLAIDLVPTGPATGVAITAPAAANPSAAGTSTVLSVGAVDASGDAAPAFSWATTLMPAGATAPTFSVNNSASANATTAAITQAGTYGFTVTATDPTSGATVSSSAKVVVNFGLFTSSIDIGSPSPAGSLSYNATSGAYTTTAGGSAIGGASDQFHYTYEGFSGGGQIAAYVASLSNSNAAAEAGPMFRDSMAANGAFAEMVATPGDGVIFQWRGTDGGSASDVQVTGVTAPIWLRLIQASGQFSGYYSTNGTSWTQVGSNQAASTSLSELAGLAVTSDASGTSTAAVIENVSLIAAPTVATAASASPSPVTSTMTSLSVLGADPTGEANLTYTWATIGTPPAPVNFSANGTNAAKNITAAFTKAGSYNFMVTITNGSGLSVTSSVGVTVDQTYSGMSISPSAPNLTGGSTQQFTATALDQFSQALVSQPAINWTLVSGPGTLTSGGLYTPPYAGGSAVVQAVSGAYSATASVTFSSEAQWNASTPGTPGSSWTTSGNWIDAFTSAPLSAPGVRGLTGDTVLFASALVAQLDGANPTLAGVTFNNAAAGYGIIQGSGGSLTLQGAPSGSLAGGSATVSVLAGSPAINAPVHLASNTTFSAAASTTLTMMGPIDGSGSLTMTGMGNLVLNAANTFSGGLVVQSGTVVVSAANGLASGSELIVGSGSASLFSSVVASAAAALVAGESDDSGSTTSASKSLSPQAVAAVMAAGPIPPAYPLVRAAILPTAPSPNFSQSVKDSRNRHAE